LGTRSKVGCADASIARGLAAADAGRVKRSTEVFDRLEAKLAVKTDRE
jgi:antitoxin ParD1/3/4